MLRVTWEKSGIMQTQKTLENEIKRMLKIFENRNGFKGKKSKGQKKGWEGN